MAIQGLVEHTQISMVIAIHRGNPYLKPYIVVQARMPIRLHVLQCHSIMRPVAKEQIYYRTEAKICQYHLKIKYTTVLVLIDMVQPLQG